MKGEDSEKMEGQKGVGEGCSHSVDTRGRGREEGEGEGRLKMGRGL